MTGYGLEAAIDSDYAGLPILVQKAWIVARRARCDEVFLGVSSESKAAHRGARA